MEAAIKALKTQPTISVAQARLVLGISDAVLRRAIAAEEIESMKLGRNIRVISEPIRKMLHLE